MKKTLFLAALVALTAAACSKKTMQPNATAGTPGAPAVADKPAPNPAPVPTQADADRAVLTMPGTTLAMLQEGQLLYVGNCGRCHGLFKPSDFSEAKWRHEVPPMVRKSRLDPSAEPKILAYVLAMREAK